MLLDCKVACKTDTDACKAAYQTAYTAATAAYKTATAACIAECQDDRCCINAASTLNQRCINCITCIDCIDIEISSL